MHTGDQRHLLGLASSAQAGIEGSNDGIVPGSDQRGHVEGGAYPSAATPDNAPPPPGAALTGERRDADQGGNGLAIQLAQFGQLRQQRQGRGGPDAGDAAQQIFPFPPDGAGLHLVVQGLVQVRQLCFQPGEVALNLRPHPGQRGVEALPLGGLARPKGDRPTAPRSNGQSSVVQDTRGRR